jgi:hypothetical protein
MLFGQAGSMILVREPAARGQLKWLDEQEPVLLLFFGHSFSSFVAMDIY